MAKADRVYITPPINTPVDTTRRHFLLAVGGGSAAMLAATIPGPAATAPAGPLDPAFSLIEAHREASAWHGGRCGSKSAWNGLAIPRRRRLPTNHATLT